MTYVSTLKLRNFRCYEQAALGELGSGLIVLHGANGAGKTNVLEALSLLSPGRGLRGARMAEVQHRDQPRPWAVAANVTNAYGSVQLGTGLDPKTEKRVVRINGENARGQAALSQHLACVWLTPQMDRLFIDSSRERRKFLDRLVFAFDPGHAGRVTRYENAMAQRSKILRDERHEPVWLDTLEAQMAETGVAIAAARIDFTARLQRACDSAQGREYFPAARLAGTGTIEELLRNAPALEIEELFKYQLREARSIDMLTGGAATGPHKGDLSVSYGAKDMPAGQCSTGEQKALLIGIVLAHARLIAAERGSAPVLLLDEVAAHLDEQRRAALYELLAALKGQVWLTGTDERLFDAISGFAQFFHVGNAQIMPQVQVPESAIRRA